MTTIDTELGELIEVLYDAAFQITQDSEDATLCVLMVLDKWFTDLSIETKDTEAA